MPDPRRDEQGRLLPGMSLNPAGRPRTTPDITADIIEDPSGGATDDIADQPLRAPGWRIEVLGAGARYIWRRGSHHKRVSAPGGAFMELTDERKQQYEQNRQRYHATSVLG